MNSTTKGGGLRVFKSMDENDVVESRIIWLALRWERVPVWQMKWIQSVTYNVGKWLKE